MTIMEALQDHARSLACSVGAAHICRHKDGRMEVMATPTDAVEIVETWRVSPEAVCYLNGVTMPNGSIVDMVV